MTKALARKSIKVEGRAWIRGENGMNWMLFGDDERTWHISYSPNTGAMITAFHGDGAGDETALCKGNTYLILNGDWRRQYEKLVDKGYEACKKFFDKHQEHRSSWSN